LRTRFVESADAKELQLSSTKILLIIGIENLP
jgi:hypothetical protein